MNKGVQNGNPIIDKTIIVRGEPIWETGDGISLEHFMYV